MLKIKSFNNYKEFSKDLHDFLYTDKMLNFLPECGWTDGGCRSLLKALQLWLGSEVTTYQIVKGKDEKHSQHVVAKIGGYYVDGDGVSTRSGLYQRWRNEYDFHHVIIREVNLDTEPIAKNGDMPYYIPNSRIRILSNALAKRYRKAEILSLLK